MTHLDTSLLNPFLGHGHRARFALDLQPSSCILWGGWCPTQTADSAARYNQRRKSLRTTPEEVHEHGASEGGARPDVSKAAAETRDGGSQDSQTIHTPR